MPNAHKACLRSGSALLPSTGCHQSANGRTKSTREPSGLHSARSADSPLVRRASVPEAISYVQMCVYPSLCSVKARRLPSGERRGPRYVFSTPMRFAAPRMQDLHRHVALVALVVREVDGGHATRAELALDAVTAGQCGREAIERHPDG